MDAVTALAKAEVLGLKLTINAGVISVHGQRTPDVLALLEQLKPMKPAIIAELERQAAALEFSLDAVDPLPLEPVPPMTIHTNRPPLPPDQWLSGLSMPDALARWQELKQTHFCTCGRDSAGWFVRCDPAYYSLIGK